MEMRNHHQRFNLFYHQRFNLFWGILQFPLNFVLFPYVFRVAFVLLARQKSVQRGVRFISRRKIVRYQKPLEESERLHRSDQAFRLAVHYGSDGAQEFRIEVGFDYRRRPGYRFVGCSERHPRTHL